MERLQCLLCTKLVAEADIKSGVVEKRCMRCKSMNRWEFIEKTSIINGWKTRIFSRRQAILPDPLPKILT